MRMLSSAHTHTTFCDGKDSPEEMVKAAIEKGFVSIGFSGHSYISCGTSYCMTDEKGYRAEIERLKDEYKGKIEIYLGIEQEYYSPASEFKYDYSIGSLHYVAPGGVMRDVDLSEEYTNETVEKFYGGSYLAYAEDYYSTVCDVINKTGADIVGHIDLITKFNEGEKYFRYDKNYLDVAFSAIDKLKGNIFEINTGAISRGYRKNPYPEKNLLKRIFETGNEIIITSDCHDKNYLDCEYEKAYALAKECGFKYCRILLGGEFKNIKIDDII